MVDQKSVAMGREILKTFHDVSLKYPEYTLTFEELLNFYGTKTPFMLEGLGDDVLSFGLITLEQAKETMRNFAGITQGEVPENWQAYHFAITRMASQPDFWRGLQFVSVETAKTVARGVQEHGKQAITTLEMYNKYLPWILLGGGILVLTQFGNQIGSAAKDLFKSIGKR